MIVTKDQIENAVAGASCHKGEVRWDFLAGKLEHSQYLGKTILAFAPVIYKVEAEPFAYQGWFIGEEYDKAAFLREVLSCMTAFENIRTVYQLSNLTEDYFRKNAVEFLPFLEVVESPDPDYAVTPDYYVDWKKSVFIGGFDQHPDAWHPRELMSRITGHEVACICEYAITHKNTLGGDEKTPNFRLSRRQFSSYHKFFTPGMGFHPTPIIFPEV